jgi:hypothetical protein
MKRTTLLTTTAALAGAALVTLGSSGATLNAAKPPSTWQVSTTIDETDSLNRPYLISGDGAAYVSTSDGLVSSTVQGGQWMLNTYALANSRGKLVVNRSNRVAFFQFSEPAGTDPLPADLNGMVEAQVHMFSTCDSALATMTPGAAQDCAGAFRLEPVSDNDTGYRLAFQPENYAEVTKMRIACTTGSSGNCTAWTISPGASASGATYTSPLDGLPRSLNKLLLLVGTSENVSSALGDNYFSFNIQVTRR